MSAISYAYLETTNYCNLNCSFCNREEVIGSLKHMPITQFKQLLSNISHHEITEAKLMGMGEPFLHPEYDQITKALKDQYPNAFVISATNCQYRIKDTFRNALKNLDMLYLSIDGYKERYEKDRSPAKWSKLISFLEELRTVDRHGCKIVVNYVVNPSNVYDIPKIQELIEEYDLGELRLNLAQDWSGDNNMIGGYTEEMISYLRDNYKGNIQGKWKWEWSDCFWLKNGLYTTVEGHVKMCCMNTAALPVGNILMDSIEKIHSNAVYQDIKNNAANNTPSNHCENCSYKELIPLLRKILE